MDRFNSREDVRFNDVDFHAGVKARQNGWKIEDCPHQAKDWARKSWRAGWCDEDMSIAAELHA
jgi:hypothetical protein